MSDQRDVPWLDSIPDAFDPGDAATDLRLQLDEIKLELQSTNMALDGMAEAQRQHFSTLNDWHMAKIKEGVNSVRKLLWLCAGLLLLILLSGE